MGAGFLHFFPYGLFKSLAPANAKLPLYDAGRPHHFSFVLFVLGKDGVPSVSLTKRNLVVWPLIGAGVYAMALLMTTFSH